MITKTTLKEFTSFRNDNKYPTEDLSAAERVYAEKHAQKKIAPIFNFKKGEVFNIVGGSYAGTRVIFISEGPSSYSIVCNYKDTEENKLFLVVTNYLKKVKSLKIDLPEFQLDVKEIFSSDSQSESEVVIKDSAEVNKFMTELKKEIAKTPYLAAFLQEPYLVDDSVEFYSQQY